MSRPAEGVLSPPAREITQWLWTGIAAGPEGGDLLVAEPAGVGTRSGEWGMLDFQGQPSDRLTAASEVARTAKAHKAFPRGPARTERHHAPLQHRIAPHAAKECGGVGRRPLRRAQSQRNHEIIAGPKPPHGAWFQNLRNGAHTTGTTRRGKTIVLTNLVALPSEVWERLDFVRKAAG